MKIKINTQLSWYQILLIIILFNSFVATTSNLYPEAIPLGKALGGGLIINIIIIYLKTLRKSDVFLFIFITFIDIVSILKSTDLAITIEHVMFLTSTILLLYKFTDSEVQKLFIRTLDKNLKLIFRLNLLILLICSLGLLINSCYRIVNGDRLFYGFAESGHKLAQNMCLVITFLLYYFHNKKFKVYQLIYFVLPCLFMLMSGSRTYLVSLLILFFIIYQTKLKEYNFRYILIPLVFFSFLFIFLKSSAFERFFIMGNNQYVSDNFWEAASSGRLIWWKIDLQAFKQLDFFNQLFGMGYAYVYNINLMYYRMKISAHNDFIMLLLSTGWIGLCGYLLIFITILIKIKKRIITQSLINIKFPICLLLLYIVWNMMINGYYGAQQYVFSTLMIIMLLVKNMELEEHYD